MTASADPPKIWVVAIARTERGVESLQAGILSSMGAAELCCYNYLGDDMRRIHLLSPNEVVEIHDDQRRWTCRVENLGDTQKVHFRSGTFYKVLALITEITIVD